MSITRLFLLLLTHKKNRYCEKSMNWFQYLLVRSFASFPTTNKPNRGRVKLTFMRRMSETKPTP